jgi:hypothetical protein
MGALLAAAETGEAIWLLGLLIVIGCLAGAAYCAFHERVVAAVLLVVVAIFAGVLLL